MTDQASEAKEQSATPPAADIVPRRIVVAGDILTGHHWYEGTRSSPTARDGLGVAVRNEHGGAKLIQRLVQAIFVEQTRRREEADQKKAQQPTPSNVWTTHLAVVPPPLDGPQAAHDGYSVWKPHPSDRKPQQDRKKVWRTSGLMGFGSIAPSLQLTALPYQSAPSPDLLLFEDAGFTFRHATGHEAWQLADQVPEDGYILFKMADPTGQGALWESLSSSDRAGRMVCLVSAHDLRRERLSLDHGLSWEATLRDLHVALQTHPAAATLRRARHLIVTFSSDGALWLERRDADTTIAHFCFDASHAEGEWASRFEGDAFGYHCAMAASLAAGLAADINGARTAAANGENKPALDLMPAIEAGLLAMRDLKENGHGPADEPPTGYPVPRLAKKILDCLDGKVAAKDRLARMEIGPVTSDPPDPDWTLIEAIQRPRGSKDRRSLLGLAWMVALHGPSVLDRLPHARFGKLLTADRNEIETLRHIRRRMSRYAADPKPERPLSIGVFGPPGAGKSFGVKQLTEEVFGGRAWREFNLSQFRDAGDLNGAFHQVRDLVLAGITPVVLWDEFDSRSLHWLQYLLAPMQDGRFQDGQLNHAIGKCVFVFAGGTSWTFKEFSPPEPIAPTQEARDRDASFRLAKGPDFVSRLDAFMDVLGPNPREIQDRSTGKRRIDWDDIGYPLRRALLIRAHLKCEPQDRVDFDPNLLRALLRVRRYRHGSRSLQKLLEIVRADSPTVIRCSNLPRPAQLEMHVDVEDFKKYVDDPTGGLTMMESGKPLEDIAAAVHETWRDQSRAEGWQMQPAFRAPYDDLEEPAKEDNRAAARRIPEILALAGMTLRKQDEGKEATLASDQIDALLNQNLERMAEAEHNGWMDHRLRNGWKYSQKRNDDDKEHPALVKYLDLPEVEKGKDRNSVRHFPDFVKRAGYRIVRLG